jgi:hypothetical protein
LRSDHSPFNLFSLIAWVLFNKKKTVKKRILLKKISGFRKNPLFFEKKNLKEIGVNFFFKKKKTKNKFTPPFFKKITLPTFIQNANNHSRTSKT